MIDEITKAWIRNPSDEKAAANGCRFNVERGAWAVWWIERFCRLYEGATYAGQPVIMRGCHQCAEKFPKGVPWEQSEYGQRILLPWDDGGEQLALERATKYNECFHAGHLVDWQYECTMRAFSWERYSDRWESWVRRFRQASVWAAKKVKKSPSLAAWGHYLTAGDGEPGNNVYFIAKDGGQAREIAGKHAMNMVEMSPELRAEYKTNKNEASMTHIASRSILKPMATANVASQKATEGRNGSMLVDETHVVDKATIKRIVRAGISRPEPMHAEFSTAGDDPDSYGFERFEYGLKVISGEIEDQGYFVANYSAPQNTTDEEIYADPVKFGKMANPAWGHTIDPEEYLADFEKSKSSPSDFAEFKMYRLNIWQHTAAPWLDPIAWAACERDWTEQDLLGRPCWLSLDLARTRDMTAIAAIFPDFDGDDIERIQLVLRFFLPEETVRRHKERAKLRDWEQAGFLILTPGNVTDYNIVRSECRKLAEMYDVQELVFDPKYAEEMTQHIVDGIQDSKGNILEEGIGVERVEFAQNAGNFAAPIDEFERLMLAGKLEHNGNPVLTWQAGNATIVETNQGYKMLQKAGGKDSLKKIDGIVASVQGLGRVLVSDLARGSVYSRRGALVIGGDEEWDDE